jgi:hypothetical protein
VFEIGKTNICLYSVTHTKATSLGWLFVFLDYFKAKIRKYRFILDIFVNIMSRIKKQIDLFEGFYSNEQWPKYRTVVHLPHVVYEWLLEFKAKGLLERPLKGKSVYSHAIVFCRSIHAYRSITNDRLPVWDSNIYKLVNLTLPDEWVSKQMRLCCSPADDRFLKQALNVLTKRAYKGDPYQRFGMPTLVAGIFMWAYLNQNN